MVWPIVAWQPENKAAQAKRGDRQTQVAGINWQRKTKIEERQQQHKKEKNEKNEKVLESRIEKDCAKKYIISAQDLEIGPYQPTSVLRFDEFVRQHTS